MRLSKTTKSKPVKPVKPVAPVKPIAPTNAPDFRLNLKFTNGVPVDHNIFFTATEGTNFAFFNVINNRTTGLTTILPITTKCNGLSFSSDGMIRGAPELPRIMTYAVVATQNGVPSAPFVFNVETSDYSN